jgi:hypothetical protein
MAITAKFDADFSDFHKETDKAKTGLTDFEKAASNVARSVQSDLLAMFSVGAGVAFIADTVAAAGALKVLSQQTQISTDDLQVMAGAMSEFGVSQEELGRGLTTLSKKIAGGDESVAGALARMGLSLQDVKDLQGEQLFLKIENGLATLKGSLRDTTSATLFGDKLGAAMAGASEGIDGAMSRWRELNTVMSKDAIDALDKYSTEINRAKTNIQAITANAIGPLAEGFNVLVDAIQRGASKWSLFAGLLPKGFAGIGTGAEGLAKTLDDLNKKTEQHGTTAAVAGRTAVAALTDEEKATNFLSILQQNAAKDLTAAQTKNLEALRVMGQLTAENAAGVGVTASEYKKYLAVMAEAEAVAKADAAANAQRVAEKEKLTELMFKRELDLYKTLQGELAATTAARLKEVNEGILKELEAQTQLNKAMGLDVSGAVAIGDSALTRYAATMRDLNIAKANGLNTTKQEALAAYELQQGLLAEARATDQVVTSTAQVPATIGAATAAFKALGLVSKEAAGYYEQLKGTIDNAIQTANTLAGMANKPKVGGSVAGMAPDWSQSLVPKYGAGGYLGTGAPGITVNINGSVLSNKDEIARVVGDAVTSSYRAGGKRLPV